MSAVNYFVTLGGQEAYLKMNAMSIKVLKPNP